MGKNKPPKPKPCKRIINPCKICLGPVNQKTGLQCQGACEAWVHFVCLNYTPGKVKDIQDGVIAVTCPCPDCKTSVPKEFRTDEPYNCNNVICPANNPPSCENESCQANEATAMRPPPVHPQGTLQCCGMDCKEFAVPTFFPTDPSDPCMEGFPLDLSRVPKEKPKCPPDPPEQCCNIEKKSGNMELHNTMCVIEKMCNTVGQLTNQINNLMQTMKKTQDADPKNQPMSCAGRGGRAVAAYADIDDGIGRFGDGYSDDLAMNMGGMGAMGYMGPIGPIAGMPMGGPEQMYYQDYPTGCSNPCHCPGNPCRRQ